LFFALLSGGVKKHHSITIYGVCCLLAAGVCLFIFTTGRLPFFSVDPLDLFEQIAKADVPYHLYPDISDSLKGILQQMLTKDPSQRAGVGFCLQHEFCSSARLHRVSELGKEFDSSDRGIVLTNDEVKTVRTNILYLLHGISFILTITYYISPLLKAFSITMHSSTKNHVTEINCAPIAETAADNEEISSSIHKPEHEIGINDEKTDATSSSSIAELQQQKSERTLKRVSDSKIAATRSKDKCVVQ
jgi:serine/threonine protein kinase